MYQYKIQTHGFTRQAIELQASPANIPLPQGDLIFNLQFCFFSLKEVLTNIHQSPPSQYSSHFLGHWHMHCALHAELWGVLTLAEGKQGQSVFLSHLML